ncbi:Protein of unknown function DUF477 domain containing protein [Aphelenchoides besseyi]|nr:Protein of unknown function DUF477 domain containing protein [Aphelenchoides besseyi]
MISLLFALVILTLCSVAHSQYNPQTYPDPRIDPAACKILFPGQLQQITSNIRNTSPPCVGSQNSNLYIIVALIDKLGTVPFESVSVEKFTNLLRSRYQNYQDIGICDTMVLIVNSRVDRQVFTVAGRDAKLSREVLQSAFHRNLVHFRNYAMGLESMVEQIVSAYTSAHIVQVPVIHNPLERYKQLIQEYILFCSVIQIPSAPVSSSVGQFAAVHGVRQKVDMKPVEKLNIEDVPEEDRVWVEIMTKAIGRCGNDPNKITSNIRAVVEEAMALSLKLISDNRYNRIEEQSQDVNSGPQSVARGKAWQTAQNEWINELYSKYERKLSRGSNQCPEVADSSALSRKLRIICEFSDELNMQAVIALCYFCENHGPRVVMTCQPMRSKSQKRSTDDELPNFYGDEMENEMVDEDARCAACSSFGSGLGIVSNDHDARTSYFSSQTPINETVYNIVKETCLRTLSVEELKSGENNSAVLFGDRESGYTLSCSFKLRDAKARGFQRQYALIVVTVDELQKMASDTFKIEQLQSGDVPLETAASRMMFMPTNFFSRNVSLDTSRSLMTIVSSEEIFHILHRQMLYLLRTQSQMLQDNVLEGIPSQDMLVSMERDPGSLEESELITSMATESTRFHIRNLQQIAWRLSSIDERFLAGLIWTIVLGDQIVVKHNFLGLIAPDSEVPVEKLENTFILRLQATEALGSSDGLDLFEFVVENNPQRNGTQPKLLRRYLELLHDHSLNEGVLQAAIKSTRSEWLNHAKLLFQLSRQREKIDLDKVVRIIRCGPEDSPVLLFFQAGLSRRYRQVVFNTIICGSQQLSNSTRLSKFPS